MPLSVMLLPVRSYWFFGATPYAAMGHTEWYSAWYRALVLGCAFVVGFAFLRVVPDEKLSITRPGSRTLYIFLLHDMIVLTALDYLGVFRLFAGGASEILGVLGLSILVTLALSSSLAVRLTRPLVDPVSLFRRRHRSPMPERDPDR